MLPSMFRPSTAPRSSRPSSRSLRALAALAVLAALPLGSAPAEAVKIANWNVINYPVGLTTARQSYLRQVVAALDPDVIAMQELKSAAGRDSFLLNVLDVVQPGQWSATSFFSTCESAIFYKPARMTLTVSGVAIPTAGPRDVLGVRFRMTGYTSKLAELRLYSVHFKAGTTAADTTMRRQECIDLRNNLNAALSTVTPNFVVCGDMNFYGDWEGGYQVLTDSTADNDGQCFDPLTMPGTWNQPGYAPYHTQSSCQSGCPSGWSTGGMDDRLDLSLHSAALRDGQGMDRVVGTYTAYGNDGQHYNQSINYGVNYAVGTDVATALLYSSDHLPVVITLQAPAQVVAASQLDFGRVIVGGTAEQALVVANGATAPADVLDYALAAPAGFSAPAGPFTAAAGAAGNEHAVSMDTGAPGAKSGSLTVASDAPDTTAKVTLLSGTVLAHAVASLDSAAVVTRDTIDFGTLAYGHFADQPVRVHNQGWTALQALLEETGGVVTGGGGRFGIVGGFQAAEIAGVGHTWTIRFDDAGATVDSLYEATLTLSGADEALPGGAAAAELVVTLQARILAGESGVAARLPERVAFLPPSPNPFHGSTTLSFELPREAAVALELFDLSGRRVTTLLEGVRPAGRHSLRMSPESVGRALEAGLYFVSFRTGDFRQVRRVVLVP